MGKIKGLHYWVQKVLPLVYDDSLSYYEVLYKCIDKINEIIAQMEQDKIDLYNSLSDYIDKEVADVKNEIPDEVMRQISELMSTGVVYNLIANTSRLYSQQYLDELFDTQNVEPLETTTGEYIYTTTGDYILVQTSLRQVTAFTTNVTSEFYARLKDAVNKVLEGKKPVNRTSWGYLSQPPVLTLIHYSDYHGDDDELNNIYHKWNDIIKLADDVICTGDMVNSRFTDPFTYFVDNELYSAKKTLLTIGNHDALADPTGFDWTNLATQQEQYDKYFAPTIAYWGVVHSGSNTYYYKDYPSQGIRLIVLNDMLQDADMYAQLEWLRTTALNTQLSVIIAKHYLPPNLTKISCPFTAIDYNDQGYGSADIAPIVQNFIDNSGKFICYLAGHGHYDYIAYLTNYPRQVGISIDAASRTQCNQYSDVMRYEDEISSDLFNVVQFDTSSAMVKLIRCGCDYDRYLRHKNTFCMNYQTKQIVTT